LSDLFIELESTESNSFKNRRNFTEQVDGKLAQSTESAESADGKQKLVHKKSLIETFQKLFKSGGKQKNSASQQQHQQQQQKSPVEFQSELVNGYRQPVTFKDTLITLRQYVRAF
jgi:hypothetical protein